MGEPSFVVPVSASGVILEELNLLTCPKDLDMKGEPGVLAKHEGFWNTTYLKGHSSATLATVNSIVSSKVKVYHRLPDMHFISSNG